MRIISFFLIVILAFCVLWGALILFGSGVIKYAVKFYSGDQIILHDVKVTPRLNVSIAKIDLNPVQSLSVSGISRGASLNWSLENALPVFKVSFGPTDFGDIGRFNKGAVTLAPLGLFDWSQVSAILEFDDIVFRDKIEISTLNINSKINENFSFASNSSFVADSIFLRFLDLNFSQLSGNLDKLSFEEPFKKQDNVLRLFAENIRERNTNTSVSDFQVAIKKKDSSLSIVSDARNLVTPNQKFSIEKVKVSTKQSIENLEISSPVKIDFENVFISDPNSKIGSGRIIINDVLNESSLDFSGQINQVVLTASSLYLANFDVVDFGANFSVTGLEHSVFLRGQLGFHFNVKPELSLVIDTAADLHGASRVEICLVNRCVLENVKISYHAEVDQDTIKGSSMCFEKKCDLKNLRHRVVTSNTSLVFDHLAKMSIFNPFVLASMYSQMLTGKVVGAGNEINF